MGHDGNVLNAQALPDLNMMCYSPVVGGFDSIACKQSKTCGGGVPAGGTAEQCALYNGHAPCHFNRAAVRPGKFTASIERKSTGGGDIEWTTYAFTRAGTDTRIHRPGCRNIYPYTNVCVGASACSSANTVTVREYPGFQLCTAGQACCTTGPPSTSTAGSLTQQKPGTLISP